ncbi:ribosomal protein S5 domain 2-type protein, partial [Obelidium mucronatum]
SFKKLHPQEFHRRFLGKGVRPDGREGLMSWRTPSIHRGSITTCNGSALVRMGGTTVICGVKAEVAIPDTNHPTTGFLVPNVDFPPIAGSQFKPTAPGEFTQSISEMIYRIVKGNNVLNLESLCIEPGKAVWTLHVDIVFLNYEGNPLDSALLALTSALADTKLPRVIYSEVEGTVRAIESFKERSVSLELKRIPFAATFGIFEGPENVEAGKAGSKAAMADPTEEEESVLLSTITIVVDGKSEDLMGTFGGQVPLPLLDICISQAKKRTLEIKKL